MIEWKEKGQHTNHNSPNPSKVFQQFQSLVLLRLQRSSLTPPLQQGNLIAAPCLHRAQVALPPLRQRFERFHLHSSAAFPLPPHRVKPTNRTTKAARVRFVAITPACLKPPTHKNTHSKGGFYQPNGRCAAHCPRTPLPRHHPTHQACRRYCSLNSAIATTNLLNPIGVWQRFTNPKMRNKQRPPCGATPFQPSTNASNHRQTLNGSTTQPLP